MRLLLATLRPPFLLLTPACVAVGVATAGAGAADPRVWIALASAMAAHAAVNGLNEVLDLRSGLDLRTVRTPFSGGSGVLPARPDLAGAALALSLLALGACIAGGVALTLASGPGLLLYGVAGVALVLAYTGPLNRSPAACLLAPGIGFGPVMVAGTHYALTGAHAADAWLASLLPMAVASNLLLVNQVPDVDADRAAGRRHLLVRRGTAAAAPAYLALVVLGWAAPALGAAAGILPRGAWWSWLALPPALAVAAALWRHHARLPALLPWMGVNVAVALAAPLLLAAGLRA